MKFALILSLFIFSVFTSAGGSLSLNSGSSADTIRIKAIPFPIEPINLSKDGLAITGENSIKIKAKKGTDLYTFIDGSFYTNNAPRVLFKPDSNFIFSAKVQSDLDSTYDGGAILLYTDESNWSKILFERLNATTVVVSTSVVRNRITDDSYNVEVKGNEVYLKLAKSGKIFNYYYSTDGRTWKLLRTFAYEPKEYRIGIYAQCPKAPEASVDFSDLKYTGKPFKDFFKGE